MQLFVAVNSNGLSKENLYVKNIEGYPVKREPIQIDVRDVLEYIYRTTGHKRQEAQPVKQSVPHVISQARKVGLRTAIAEAILKVSDAEGKISFGVSEMLISELATMLEKVEDKGSLVTYDEAQRYLERIQRTLIILRDNAKE